MKHMYIGIRGELSARTGINAPLGERLTLESECDRPASIISDVRFGFA